MFIKRTPFDYPLLALLVIYLFSSYFSLSRYTSMFGFLTLLSLALLYWFSVWNLSRDEIKNYFKVVLISGVVSGIVFLVDVLFSFPFLANPLGGLSTLVAFLGLLVPIALFLSFHSKKGWEKIMGILIIGFFIVLIAFINFLVGWIVLGVGAFASLVVLMNHKNSSRNWVILPLAVLVLSILWPFFKLTPIYRLDIPAEVSLGRSASFGIAQNTVHSGIKSALIGSGPATFQFDFSKFRSKSLNDNPLWQVRFSQAHNQLLEFWATVGYLGAVALLLLVALAVFLSFSYKEVRSLLPVWMALLAVGWYLTFSIPIWLILFLLLIYTLPSSMVRDVKLPLGRNQTDSIVSSSIFVLGVVAVVLFLGFLSKVYLADFQFRGGNYEEAVELNPAQSAYHMALAQDSLQRALSIADDLGSSDSEEIQQKQAEIRALVSSSINNSQEAVRRSPNNSALWQMRGAIFRDARVFSNPEDQFAKDANDWIVQSLTQAIELEPNNPSLYLDLGLAYEAQGDTDLAVEELLKAVDLKSNLAISRYELGRIYYNREDNDEAIDQLERSVILNQNYANALYSLALAYERNDRLNDALILLERVEELNPDNDSVKEQVKRLKSLDDSSEEEE